MIYLAAGLNLLAVNPGLLFWTLVTFLLVVLILWKFAWNPIISALDARADKIDGDIQKAEKLRTEAESLLESYNKKLASAKEDAKLMLDEASRVASELREKSVKETQDEIKAMKEQSLREIELAKTKAVQIIQDEVVELSVTIAGNILQKQLSTQEHSTFVKSQIAKIKSLSV